VVIFLARKRNKLPTGARLPMWRQRQRWLCVCGLRRRGFGRRAPSRCWDTRIESIGTFIGMEAAVEFKHQRPVRRAGQQYQLAKEGSVPAIKRAAGRLAPV
jgi:hypothetical protein